jgi:hypothetical protein
MNANIRYENISYEYMMHKDCAHFTGNGMKKSGLMDWAQHKQQQRSYTLSGCGK